MFNLLERHSTAYVVMSGVYAWFNNDADGNAVRNGLRLRGLIRK